MESMTDLQQHIRKRLTEIEDLDERKDAREILLEGLVPIFELMEKLKREHDTAIMLITHDMGVVSELADDVYENSVAKGIAKGVLATLNR